MDRRMKAPSYNDRVMPAIASFVACTNFRAEKIAYHYIAGGQPHTTLAMILRERNGKSAYIALSELTTAELLALKDFLDDMIALAGPIVARRDREAMDAFERGEDADDRIYRGPPQIITRPWARKLDREILLNRPELLPQGLHGKHSMPTGDSEESV